MKKSEVKQRAIGLLTLSHGMMHERSPSDTSEVDRLKLLMDGALIYPAQLSTTEECAPEVERVVGEVVAELAKRYEWMVEGLIEALVAIAVRYEDDFSDADIPGILQEVALNIATE
jgi:hypothetical protein